MSVEAQILKVLIVDDSPQVRKSLKSVVVWELSPVEITEAQNGRVALEKAAMEEYDLILLDLSMPEMDGFTFLRLFRARSKTPVLVVSSLNDIIYVDRALDMGASAFLGKPGDISRNQDAIREEFRLKLQRLLPRPVLSSRVRQRSPFMEERPKAVFPARKAHGDFPVVAIGCSSGGPPTLQFLLSGVPGEIRGAVIIAQHMPRGFTTGMVERLKRLMPLDMSEASDGDEIREGTIYFCPGGMNMKVATAGDKPVLVAEKPGPRDIAPNVDMLFTSAAQVFGKRLTGIVLTGMGRDGAEGVKEVKARGGTVYAESDETAAIYGMPREAAATGCVDTVMALPDISIALIRILAPDYQ